MKRKTKTNKSTNIYFMFWTCITFDLLISDGYQLVKKQTDETGENPSN